ncbi:MAG: HypC/HybG/HupF family hydrogenase formation chaperone [Patescibacteria group bacterium]
MCLAFPGKIISVNKNFAIIDFNGIKKEINILLTPGIKKNDYALVHSGFAIQKMDKQEAKKFKDFL